MTSNEIKQMFQANAALKQSFPADPAYSAYLNAVQKLTAQYIHDVFTSNLETEQQKKMNINDAFNVIMKTCEIATQLENEYHPDGISDEHIKERSDMRKNAIDCILRTLVGTCNQ